MLGIMAALFSVIGFFTGLKSFKEKDRNYIISVFSGIVSFAALIVALAIGIGVGIGNVPEALGELPTWVSNIFAQNGIIMTFVIATILNLVLPKDKEKIEAVNA